MADPLHHRIALITGAASGIGRAIATTLRDRGMHVGALDRTDDVPAGTTPIVADVTDSEQVRTAIDTFAADHGHLDLLVNNAGISLVGTIEDNDEADWQRVFDVNVFGQFRVTRAVLPWLRKSDAASIVMMSSCSATNGIPQRAVYSASKGAIQSLTAALAVDLLDDGIRVNAVSPATVDTPFVQQLISDDPARLEHYHARQPTGRMVTPAEIANAVAYLADPTNPNLTGTTITIDGGMATLRPNDN